MAGMFHNAGSAGDLMLLVGPDKEAIRASSIVLSLASPDFARMLGSHFAKGQSLLERGSLEYAAVSPTEVTLSDDDPEAMTLFCDTIHFKRHATSDIALPLLAKIASLSDKYHSSLALSSESEIWLSNFKGSKEGESCFVKMLWISYALDNHRAFSSISREMVRQYSHEELARQKHEIDCTSLPETVIESLEDIRASDVSNLCDEIGSVLTRHIKMTCPDKDYHHSSGKICFRVSKSGFYIQELYRIGLWPIPDTSTQKSIEEISNCLLGFENDTFIHRSKIGPMCDVANIDFKDLLLQATERTMKRSRGLCLNCVKKGRIMIADGNCRATSLELCAGIFN